MATDFTFTVRTDKTPREVFQAIKQVRSWWSGLYEEEFSGDSENLGDEFSFRAGGGAHYSKQKLVEIIPDEKLVWLITESDFTFIEKADEWTGTKLVFEISEKGGQTELIFTHVGLTPEVECYDACAPAWSQYLKEKFLPFVNQ
ncbi:SRPBCC domain-containing protein [Fluviicola taffensis]|uniref:SRPBCC family protein n=1 Tax=Fluviicola taffensis TaxID=191579 RepID=UPI0031379C9F